MTAQGHIPTIDNILKVRPGDLRGYASDTIMPILRCAILELEATYHAMRAAQGEGPDIHASDCCLLTYDHSRP